MTSLADILAEPTGFAADAAWHLDPPGAAYDGSEIVIQQLLRTRAKVICPGVALMAVPNGGKRTQWAAMNAKREGLSAGFPDIGAFWKGGGVAFFEMKARAGVVSVAQREWLDRLTGFDIPAGVFRHPDTALEWLRGLGAPFIDRVGL